ncbi:O-antigen translocase [Pedobacter sp. Leaf250]|uniref:O-antigen translocase n=1 Tax=Pedobacter sp. Leaf250 TaxID=2876559 RepID=UPI001E2A400C|nr:O-antigen translocase [Pedobacter sp. Leaf250]
MIKKIGHILSKDVVKVFSLNAMATLVKMLTSFVSIKIVAVLIGPAGIALLGQLSNFSSIFLSLSTGGINSGVTKYVAQHQNSPKKIELYLQTSVWITIICTIIGSIVLILGSGYFSHLILNDTKFQSIIIVFGITLILYAANNLLLSVLNGYKHFKLYVRINMLGSILSLLFSAILAYFYGIYGALLASITYQSVVFIVTFLYCLKCKWFTIKSFFGRFSKFAGIRLAHYSAMALVSAATVPVSQLIVRSRIVQHASLHDAGIWEGVNKISGMYLMVITTSLAIYYLPRFSELVKHSELRREVISAYRLIIPILVIISLSIFFLQKWIILILFNSEFLSMKELFPFQLIGDFFKIAGWILSFQMVAKSMSKMYVITELLSSVCFVVISFLLVNRYGVYGATVSYAITYIFYFILMVMIFRKLIFNREQ